MTSQTQLAYLRLEKMIVTGKLRPGTFISNKEISEFLELEKTPIEEAIKKLTTYGLLKSLSKKGMCVTKINYIDLIPQLETRKELDNLISQLAAKKLNKKLEHALKVINDDLELVAESGCIDKFMKLDFYLDQVISLACENKIAAEAVRSLHAHTRRIWYLNHNGTIDVKEISILYRKLLTAIVEKNPAKAGIESNNLIEHLVKFALKIQHQYIL